MLRSLPETIRAAIAGKPFAVDQTGLSGSEVILFDDFVLKIEPNTAKAGKTVEVMSWLAGKLPVPKILHFEIRDGKSYLLMTRLPGKMACDRVYLKKPRELVRLLAEGLQMLWRLDLSGCPRARDLETELAEARERVEKGLIDVANTEPETFGEGGFRDPAALLAWLEAHKPSFEPVFSHGDFCLPNIFFDRGKVSGFLDLGDAGVGDKWRDIALCYRSLKHNFDGTYGSAIDPDFDSALLFEALGIEPDWEKLRYYMLLDELF